MPAKKHYTKPGSIPYKEAGQRARLALQRLRDARWRGADGRGPERSLPPAAWRVTFAVVELTATYSKAWDETYVEAVAELAGVDRPTASRWLPRLAALHVLRWRPSKWSKSMSLVGLPDENDETCVPADTSNKAGHVSTRTRNGVPGDTLPKVTEGDRSADFVRSAGSAGAQQVKCGECKGPTTIADGVASCDGDCFWSKVTRSRSA